MLSREIYNTLGYYYQCKKCHYQLIVCTLLIFLFGDSLLDIGLVLVADLPAVGPLTRDFVVSNFRFYNSKNNHKNNHSALHSNKINTFIFVNIF